VISEDLRRSNARGKCCQDGIGFSERKDIINVVWHIRNGDLCLYCNDQSYFRRVHDLIVSSTDGLHKPIGFTFISENQAPIVSELFPEATQLFGNGILLQTVCVLLTADIVVASGSSFPIMLSIFAPKNSQIIFEEARKEFKKDGIPVQHFFNSSQAVLIYEGMPLSKPHEIRKLVYNVLVNEDKTSTPVH
jgi:hypothetical protein